MQAHPGAGLTHTARLSAGHTERGSEDPETSLYQFSDPIKPPRHRGNLVFVHQSPEDQGSFA